MLARQPFHRRIAIAFTLMTLVVSGLFALGIVTIVHEVEEALVSQEMEGELLAVLQDLSQGQPPRVDRDTRFFAAPPAGPGIPPRFDTGRPGFAEVVAGDEAYYVYARSEGERRYVLVRDQHEFEAREHALFKAVYAGFLLSVLGAWLLGRLVARRVMAPVVRLAAEVGRADHGTGSAAPLAPHYANDEIGRLAAAFDAAFGQLRRALERERLFTSDVSHELRTPLTVLSTSCELLDEALDEAGMGEKERRQWQRIRRAAEEMQDLVQTFLTLARAETAGPIPGPECALLAVAREQAGRWAPPIAEKGLDFQLRVLAEDHGSYNATLLATVISNLLRNSLHYTESGWVRLTLMEGGFRVEDSGIGIEPAQQARIFDPFVRGAPDRGEGLGLGLSLVKRICVRMGWEVAVESLPPRGSRFEVRLGRGRAAAQGSPRGS